MDQENTALERVILERAFMRDLKVRGGHSGDELYSEEKK